MRKLSVLPLVALAGWLGFCAAPAQEPAGGIIYSQHRQFRIPFNAGPGAAGFRQLQLFYSADQGKTWLPAAISSPDQRFFRFQTDRDGYFWFTVQTTDVQGRVFPASLDGAQPSLKVVVDTQPPAVVLQALPPRGGEVGVSWAVRDENLDLALPESLRLEYRLAGSVTWLPLAVSPTATQHYWNPQSTGLVEVRLGARDRAGNRGQAGTTVSLAGGGGPPASLPNGADGGAAGDRPPQPEAVAPPDRKLVNSTTVSLNCEVKEKGPSGVSEIELWWTTDARSWNKYAATFKEETTLTFKVYGEGVYGVTLIAKSGVGLGDRPPQIGDRPQLWVEVDTTKPQVQLHSVIVGTGADKGKLTVLWKAWDKNLGPDPITLSYAEQATGPWKAFAEKLPNNGRHVWTMPDAVPYQFHVKAEATDLAGNVGEAVTENLVKVDLANPKVKINSVAPGGK